MKYTRNWFQVESRPEIACDYLTITEGICNTILVEYRPVDAPHQTVKLFVPPTAVFAYGYVLEPDLP